MFRELHRALIQAQVGTRVQRQIALAARLQPPQDGIARNHVMAGVNDGDLLQAVRQKYTWRALAKRVTGLGHVWAVLTVACR